MRFNEGAMKFTARNSPPEKEGRLQYRGPRENYRERWFKLRGNLLFYFRTNEFGHLTDQEAVGLIILEHCKIQLEPLGDTPFLFTIEFEGEPSRRHFFGGQTQQQCEDWVTALKKASIENLRAEMLALQTRIRNRTGKDPMDNFSVPPPVLRHSCPLVSTAVNTRHRKPHRTAPRPPVSTTAVDEPLITLSTTDGSSSFTRPWVMPVQEANPWGPTTIDCIQALPPALPTSRSKTTVSPAIPVPASVTASRSGWEAFE